MTVRGRWSLAVTALVVVAAVALLFWPRPPLTADLTAQAGPHQVRLQIATPTVGAHDVTVRVGDADSVQRLVVAPVMVEMGHAAAPVTATASAPGHYLATGVEFFMSGRWDVEVTLHGPDGPVAVVFPVLVEP
jgi:hypothetical protein